MKITIGFELESGVDDAQMIAWLNGILAGESPVKAKKKRERQPMPEGPEKEALKKRLADGRARKAAERAGEKLAKKSKSTAAKKPSKSKKKK